VSHFYKLFYMQMASFIQQAAGTQYDAEYDYSVSQKKSPLRFSEFFPKRLGIFSPNFTCLLYVPIYAEVQIFIKLSATLTNLCHIKCDHRVHIMCSKCPPSAEMHAFRRLQKLLIALLSIVCGKSSQICCSALFNSGMVFGFD